MSANEENPHPFVYWAQSKSHVYLRVDLKDVKNPDIHVKENYVQFAANGIGARGISNYGFKLELHSKIDPELSQYRITARHVEISLKKEDDGWWPRVISTNLKLTWLKIDFDKWKTEDDEQEEEEKMNLLNGDFPDDKFADLQPKFDQESMKKIYLFVYNLWQFLGFVYIFGLLATKYSIQGEDFIPEAYKTVEHALKFCQLMQFLEILHPLFGYTKGGLAEAIVQVGGRFVILFCLVAVEPRIQPKPVIFYLIMTWSTIELIRYPYYMTRVYNKDIGIITWLRYTVWIPLYPLGFLCEGITILRCIPYFEETGKFSVSLPNSWNFAFHYPTLMRIYLLFFFLPAMYTMMSHMQRQRTQKLGPRQQTTIHKKYN